MGQVTITTKNPGHKLKQNNNKNQHRNLIANDDKYYDQSYFEEEEGFTGKGYSKQVEISSTTADGGNDEFHPFVIW